MERMVRKQLYISAQQEKELKRQAKELGVPEAEIVRASLERFLAEAMTTFEQGSQAERDAPTGGHRPLVRVLQEAPAVMYHAGQATRERGEMFTFKDAELEGRGSWEALSGRDRVAWEDELSFMKTRGELKATGGERGWSRDEVYDERLSGGH